MLGIRKKEVWGEREQQDSAVRNELGPWRRNGTRNKKHNFRVDLHIHMDLHIRKTELKLTRQLK